MATTFDIHGSGPNDVWIVGEQRVGTYPFWTYHNFSAHFDGNSWTNVDVPSIDPNGYHNNLTGVVSISPTEAYAAGSTKWGGTNQVQIFRWDGSAWTLEALNIINETGSIMDLGTAGDQIWAVGDRPNNSTPPEASGRGLALRRTDSGWVEEFVPMLAALGRATNTIEAIDGISADDAWAVGHARQVYTPGPSFAFSRFIVHWDGTQWTLDSTLPFKERSVFSDVEAVAHDDVWAVGYEVVDDKNRPMIAHYNGSAWSQVKLEPLANGALLRGVAAKSPVEVYALGAQIGTEGVTLPLIYKYDGNGWSIVPVAPSGGTSAQFMDAFGQQNGTLWGVGLLTNPATGPLTQRLDCDAGNCPADTNSDGTLSPADFSAWVAAFNSQSPACDQNADGLCTPADFSAWVANYNAGC